MLRRSLITFLGFTFAVTWGIAILLVAFPAAMTTWFGPMSARNPLFIIAVCSPTLAALVVTASTEGRAGLQALLQRSFHWRFGIQWYLIPLLGIPALGMCAAMLSGGTPDWTLQPWYWLIPAMFSRLLTDPGPLGEELGWRGYALPRLLKERNPLVASLILGVIWFIWHLPAFLIGGTPQTGLSLQAFLLSALSLSILATWLYQNTQGSVIPSILLHLAANFALERLAAPLVWLGALLAIGALLVIVTRMMTYR